MRETAKSKWRALLCHLFEHRGNVQWGEYDENGNPIHKCSFCWRVKKNEVQKLVSELKNELIPEVKL
jgi:hypothetical protein